MKSRRRVNSTVGPTAKQVSMNDWFGAISTTFDLPAEAAHGLIHRGFAVLRSAVPRASLGRLTEAYETAVSSATKEDTKVGSTSTRVEDFVNRGKEFDDLYVHPPLLNACCRVIGQPFKLSSFHARTLRPHARSGQLHTDVRRNSADWPLLSFIFMVDEFRPENGATRFVPGSHPWPGVPEDSLSDPGADYEGQVLACGPAGSLLIFNGSVWHDHSANTSGKPRRSLQGAFIPRDGHAGTDFAVRMQPETRLRLSPLAQYVLAL
ncbi:MAG TPA: phytanoyl-CoA dioxygenase family protein [Pyrinomonadaceae bacterium]|nr:phytanoyl-CoA dioxygenase family protein [Pyrinomonadaceae bacterium]